MNLVKIQVFCLCSLTVFVSSATVNPLKGTGHPNVSIVGGIPARAGEFPFMTRLNVETWAGEPSLCGGTLIGPYHVLTAAHCYAPNGTTLYLNTLSSNGGGPGSLTRSVKKFIKYEKYSIKNKTYDIAILLLNAPVTTIPLVKLPSKSNIHLSYANMSAVIAGWGLTAYNSDTISPILLKTTVKIYGNQNCSTYYKSGKTVFVGSMMLCALGIKKDTCQGDSGGPILVNGFQVGITSFGSKCGNTTPGVYTRITAYLDWIAATMKSNPK
ncbi:trypsin alpha-3-like [Daphnia pulicaria]|uniref:trypsin alpha-3-like n=1 Tax=Daphnia pulicaria TaxID=35523 RepID=UPI001EE9F06E|nr:trypsin alpha-3-like [Daphnia pulicaria]